VPLCSRAFMLIIDRSITTDQLLQGRFVLRPEAIST
jgi:hypothetical protein